MDVVERLTLESAQADTLLAREHTHRYEFAAGLCAGRRVLDLCCGSGYGSAILAAQAERVTGVDNDVATVDTAQATLPARHPNVSFAVAEAVAYLAVPDLRERFDVVVCFEGLEHLHGLDEALGHLRRHAADGLQIVASVPNDRLFGEPNPFHVTKFGYDEALAAFAGFPATTMIPQYLAEGSVLCPEGAQETEAQLSLEDRREPEYANHFIFCINFDAQELARAHHARISVSAAPIYNRWSEGLKHANRALRRENARLARGRLGKSGSAAASALAGIAGREAQFAALEQRCQTAEARVAELEAAVAGGPRAACGPEADLQATVTTALIPSARRARGETFPDGDPNSWESRRVRAAEHLIPWIEQTVPLAGKTVLEYGCGNAAVSCAVAERAQRLIGVDVDPAGIELGRREVQRLGQDNVELELHPVEEILDAVATHRGEVDVFLLYAVLEHLTVSERLAVLRLAREVVEPGGAIVVCETPNRLIYFDHHTAQMPFFHLLPDELALEYYPRSQREDFRSALDAAAQRGRAAGLEAIARWGRGVSFHEFEVAFDDLSQHVLASNYDPLLFEERPVHADEVILARYLARWRPDLAPVWSRYWLDLILAPEPVTRRAPFLRPWTADTGASRGVSWTREETLRLPAPASSLWVDLPHPTNRLVVGVQTEDRDLAIALNSRGSEEQTTSVGSPNALGQAFVSLPLSPAAQTVAIGATKPCELVFVGYED
jgi:2-polyprenyl-3-methyl-5-hydroxy-6-metoxy-1,4-benzoquinol methylase